MSTQSSASPLCLTIDANASCQLRCPTCPTTSNGYPPAVGCGHLHADSFGRLLDANPQIRSVEFENRGEMFLNPELLDVIRLARERGLTLRCDSGANMNTVKTNVLDGLAAYGFRSLTCSIDGATEDTYRQYRVGGDLRRVLENIRTLNECKKKHRSMYPRLTWQFVVFGHNEHEIPRAKEMARELGMAFIPKMSWDSKLSPIRDPRFVKAHTGWIATTREEYASLTGRDYMRSTCFQLWHSPKVNWDGRILGCCWNSWAEFGGNAFTDGYVTAINGEKISYARRLLLGQAPCRDDLPCSTCELYHRLRDTRSFLTELEIAATTKWLYRTARELYRGFGLTVLRRVYHSLKKRRRT